MVIKVLRTAARDNGGWKPESFNSSHPRVDYPDLLVKLNAIIEWEFCKWPLKLGSETERDFEYLGKNPELQPGDVFSIGEQGNLQMIRVISKDSIGIEHTETGARSLDRIWNEMIKAEIDLFFESSVSPGDIEIEDIDIISIPETHTLSHQIPYWLYKIWRDKCLFGRDWLGENRCLKIVFSTDLLVYPVTCYMTGYRILFNPSEVEGFGDSLCSEITYGIMDWFYNNFERLGVEKDTMPENSIGTGEMGSSYSQVTNLMVQNTAVTPSVDNSNSTSDTDLDEDFGKFNPNEVYHYAVRLDGEDEEFGKPGELYLYLVKKSQWDQEGAMDGESLDPRFEEKYIPEFSEAMEGIYEVPDIFKTKEDVYSHLSSIPVFEFNQDFEDFINK